MRDKISVDDLLLYIMRRMQDIENCAKVISDKKDKKFLILKKRYDKLSNQMEIIDSIYCEYIMYIQNLTSNIISEEKNTSSYIET